MSLARAFATVLAALAVAAVARPFTGVNFLDDQWSPDRLDSANATTSLQLLLSQTKSSYMALSFTWFQYNISTTTIYPRPTSPTAAQLAAIVAEAHARNVGVMIRPLVDPDWSNPATAGTWRGMIGTGFTSAQWTAWFASYSAYVLRFAALAQSLEADSFCVGAELDTASVESGLWLDLVAEVRKVYSGPILYAASHGTEASVTWWGALDYIGVDAYYDLPTASNPPTVPDLVAAWQPHIVTLGLLSGMYGKQVIFAELGYCSTANANIFETANCVTGPVDLTAQANLYQATYEAFEAVEWLDGILWWAWLTAPDGGSNGSDPGFSPANKPAASIMASWATPQESKPQQSEPWRG